jgi:preprotein translocase subunit SecG
VKTFLTILQVLSAVGIVGLVLLQRGKGADAGAGFGAGASGTVFGARGASTGLSRATAILAAIFMLNSLMLTYVFQRDMRAPEQSLLDQIPANSDAAGAPSTNVPLPAAPSSAVPTPADTVPANVIDPSAVPAPAPSATATLDATTPVPQPAKP